ncbi:hypothetical protein D3C80_1614310 [compost metagenome]
MDRSEEIDTHHLRDATSVVSVGLVNLCLQERLRVPCLDADRRQPGFSEATEQPLRQRPGLKPNPYEIPRSIGQNLGKVVRMADNLHLAANLTRFVYNAYGGLFDRNVQSGKMLHAALPL